MRATKIIFNYIGIFLIGLLLSDCKRKQFSSNNFSDPKWTASLINSKSETANFSDTSTLNIRISTKKIMLGYLKPNSLDPRGAYGQLLKLFNRFYSTPHNPYTRTEYLFVNGDNKGETIATSNDPNELFDEKYYKAKTNNLHFQFKKIASEIMTSKSKRTFYVLLSDGETTIRKYQNDNRSELSDIENAVKDILRTQPDICIGTISVLGYFNGDYQYDPDEAGKQITCQRYLYAFCFFDKSFMPEFERFAEEAKKLYGESFVFNAKFPSTNITSHFNVYPLKNGAKNKSTSPITAAYYFPRNMADSIMITSEISGYKFIKTPDLNYSVSYFEPIKRYELKKGEEIQTGIASLDKSSNSFSSSILFNNSSKSGIYVIDFRPIYSKFPADFVQKSLANQNVDDNTIREMNSILSPNDTLKTEGLKDLYNIIISGLNDIQQPQFYRTLISIKKN